MPIEFEPDLSGTSTPKTMRFYARHGIRRIPILKADAATLTFAGEKDGKLRIADQGWEGAKVALPGEWIELKCEGGQSPFARKASQSDIC